MIKKLTAILLMATTLFYASACNNGTSTDEAKDTSMAATKDSNSSMSSETKDEGMIQPMTSMMDKMNGMSMTGDLDNDFAAMMIEHHQGAVDLSEMEASKGTDSAMVTMAKNMIADHKSEIEQLKSFISHHEAMHKDKDTAAHKHEAGSEDDLSSAMKAETSKIKDIKTAGNADKDYAMLMQAHHEDAIEMSKAEVAHGHHAELKKMAQKMMMDDGKEVKIFKDYLSSHP